MSPKADSSRSSVSLLALARQGDRAALEELIARFLPRLRRWARGRLPRRARDLMDTEDIVQEALTRAVRRIRQFEPRHDAALEVYLREAVANRLRDEARRIYRMPSVAELPEDAASEGASPLRYAIGRETFERYEQALGRLSRTDREAIIARLELGYAYDEVALLTGKSTADAARQTVLRAVVRLADEMRHVRSPQ